ncbi:hypothetical protein RclHR1_07410005 [Rhizophagus clarus]|uniref:Uncharacterized protein n=1 Tax=Rhizophagus clarus TaxID=94130 RepID=A0A2Z6SLC9_9GLOM|nr:hypothetical protein RclHR1_07410005 [Rhizophagus clarus]
MTFEYSQELTNDYEKLFEIDEGYDVIIYAGNNEKHILEKLQGSDALKHLMIGNELKVQTLILCIQEYLIKQQREYLQQNPLEILKTVYHMLLSQTCTPILSSWIEKKNQSYYSIRNIPYNFNLLYRASMDDNTVAASHANKCDNKGATSL